MHINRRHFLKSSLGSSAVLTFGGFMPDFLARAADTSERPLPRHHRSTILVVVQLTGGNDGLNTVVPFEDDAYHRDRPTLALPRTQLYKITDTLGFHPDMAAFHRLHQEGRLSIIQGVGYPKSSRDHNLALRDWQTAHPGQAAYQSGWIGRAIDHVAAPTPEDLPGAFIGSIPTPFSLQTQQNIVPAFPSLDDWSPMPQPGADNVSSHFQNLTRLAEADRPNPNPPLLRFLQETTRAAWNSAQRLAALAHAENSNKAKKYPPFQLAQTLHTVAQLIRADLGIRIYHLELGGGGIGGFDTHANQAANHGALLRQLTESVAAFLHDLHQDNLLSQVLLMTFSEFGRTVVENGRRGTDHGAAAPLFLAGAPCKKSLVGDHPSLTDLDAGGLKFQIDFRQIYATLLDHWLGFDSHAILGHAYPSLDLL